MTPTGCFERSKQRMTRRNDPLFPATRFARVHALLEAVRLRLGRPQHLLVLFVHRERRRVLGELERRLADERARIGQRRTARATGLFARMKRPRASLK